MQFWCCLRLHGTIKTLHCVSHLLIDKELYVTPEKRVTEVTPRILLFIPHFVHVEEGIILLFAFPDRVIINTTVSPKARKSL